MNSFQNPNQSPSMLRSHHQHHNHHLQHPHPHPHPPLNGQHQPISTSGRESLHFPSNSVTSYATQQQQQSSSSQSQSQHQPSLISNSLAIRQEIQRFESVHPSIYAIYDLIELLPNADDQIAHQIRDHVVCIEGKSS